jgi:DNA-binding MarR family transcriptional regulator
VARRDDLRRVEQALTRISRISLGREASRIRAERSGVHLSRPSISILSTLRLSGPVRLRELSRRTDLEAPLISREIRELMDAGLVRRTSDPTDGRAGIVELTTKGRQASEAYRAATDDIIADTFSRWTAAELRALAGQLERVAGDFSRPPRPSRSVAAS